MSRMAADVSVFHAIADPTRRAILDVLRDGERTVGAMMAAIGATRRVTQSAFSQHLAVLRRARLVASRKQGRARVYSFNGQPLHEVLDWVHAYDRFWTEKLDRLGGFLDANTRAADAAKE